VQQRSQSLPYTHPQSIRKFIAEPMDEDIYIFTTGLEGMIHMWRFNTVSSLAEYVCAYEGHVREVTSILLKGSIFSLAAIFSSADREPHMVRICGLHH
jgi:hypothetical protein